MEGRALAAGEIVSEIRRRLAARPERSAGTRFPARLRSTAPAEQVEPGTDATLRPMLADENLDWLHRHWAVPNDLAGAHLPAAKSSAKAAARHFVARAVFSTLRRYLDEERELFAHLVRMADDLARRSDTLSLRLEELESATRRSLWSTQEELTRLQRRFEELEARLGPATAHPEATAGEPAPPRAEAPAQP